jgi:2-dehydro-3-deoxygluconokinase
MPKTVLSIGECMVEMAPTANGTYRMGFAGDTFNTAWYLARLGGADIDVAYMTALGDDPTSRACAAFMAKAGITPKVHTIERRGMGLYLISVKEGERSFQYWRDTSAARLLAQDLSALDGLSAGDVAYFSGITLAILSPDQRAALLAALSGARGRGVQVIFDPNLRPRLWDSTDEMTASVMQAAAVTDVALPSFEDEASFFGDADPAATLHRYQTAGVELVIAKDGPRPVQARAGSGPDVRVTPQLVERPVDTTAAGDSFNAAFIAGYLNGDTLDSAIAAGCALSARVVSSEGALVPI